MNSSNDLPNKPTPTQQQPRTSNPLIWKAVFIPLLVVNVIFVAWVAYWMSQPGFSEALTGLVVMFYSFPLGIVDFIATFFYIRTQYPQGKAKVISYITFIALDLILSYLAWTIIVFWLWRIIDRNSEFYPLLFNPVINFSIVIVATIFIAFALLPKSRK